MSGRSHALHKARSLTLLAALPKCYIGCTLLASTCMHAMTISVRHHVVQQLNLHRSSQQHLVLHMQGQPQQQKALEAVRTPLSPLNRHTNRSPATRIPQPLATGVLTPERLLADEVKAGLEQLCLHLCSLLSTSPLSQLQSPSSPLPLVSPPVWPSCQHSACLCDVLVHRPDCSRVAAAVCHVEPHCQAVSGQ